MDFALTADQIKCIDQARDFAPEFKARFSGTDPLTEKSWQYLGRNGWLGQCIPADDSGVGRDALTTVLGFETLGKSGLSRSHIFSIGAHLFGCAMAISNHGTKEQKTKWLPGLCSGEMVGALAFTGLDGGSNTQSTGVEFTLENDHIIVSGTKTFVTNGDLASVFILSANEASENSAMGSSVMILPRDTKGLEIEILKTVAGLKASPMARLTLKNCRLPQSAFLGGKGAGLGLILSILGWERSCILAGFLGALDQNLIEVTDYFRRRKGRTGSLLSHQGISHKLADVRRQIEAARWLMYRGAWDLKAGTNQILYPSLTKLTVSRTLVDCTMILNELMAGSAWTGKFDLTEALQDVIGTLSASGTSNVQLNAISSQLERL